MDAIANTVISYVAPSGAFSSSRSSAREVLGALGGSPILAPQRERWRNEAGPLGRRGWQVPPGLRVPERSRRDGRPRPLPLLRGGDHVGSFPHLATRR